MLNEQQLELIDTYVNVEYFDRKRLINYLNTHDIVGNEIFSYTNKTNNRNTSTSPFLDDELGFSPIETNKFVKRIPFYYYVSNTEKNMVGDLHCYLSGLYTDEDVEIEYLYLTLEKAFYTHNISLENIMEYTITQTGYTGRTNILFQWVHYLDICKSLRWTDLMPENFIYAYNNALQSVGEKPIIYEVQELYTGDYFYRNGDEIIFEGQFPCYENGQPVMEWIGIRVKNPASIICNGDKKTKTSRLSIKLKPDTLISVLNCYNSSIDEDTWYQIYAGPKLMEFDYATLKNRRIDLGYTQKCVADAIETSVRTYQKWESGTTTPDGCNLLRLMNFLDITNTQEIIKYII